MNAVVTDVVCWCYRYSAILMLQWLVFVIEVKGTRTSDDELHFSSVKLKLLSQHFTVNYQQRAPYFTNITLAARFSCNI